MPKRRDDPSFGTAYASVHPGFEEQLTAEFVRLGIPARLTEGGASFPGSLSNLHTAHVHSRLAGRILVRLGTVRAPTLAQLAASAKLQPWKRFVHPRQPVDVDVVLRGGAKLRRKDAVAKKVSLAVADALRGPRLAGGRPPHQPARILVRVVGDRATLSMDASGGLLHKRGCRKSTAAAPLRENLAAALLEQMDWKPTEPLVDPMCGSGTFGIEAACIARGMLPGAGRTFAFHRWPGVDPQRLKRTPPPTGRVPTLLLGDRSERAIEAARANARRAGVVDSLRFRHLTLEELDPPANAGVVLFNPPWGTRLSNTDELNALYRRWGHVLRERWVGWRVGIVLPAGDALNRFGLGARVLTRFEAGGIPVVFARAQL
jgi:putative N6-adenine-specific DNA methylase